MIDAKDTNVEHIRIKETSGDLLFDPSGSLGRRNTEFNRPYESFNFSARVLMYGYVLASCEDEREVTRRPLQSAVKHITAADAHSRSGARIQQ